jgi:hypothetical protein
MDESWRWRGWAGAEALMLWSGENIDVRSPTRSPEHHSPRCSPQGDLALTHHLMDLIPQSCLSHAREEERTCVMMGEGSKECSGEWRQRSQGRSWGLLRYPDVITASQVTITRVTGDGALFRNGSKLTFSSYLCG